jgi:hypothetical protein
VAESVPELFRRQALTVTLAREPATGRIAVGADVSREGSEAREVSREDVALVAAAVLNDDSTIHRTIDFNNGDLPIPEALSTG